MFVDFNTESVGSKSKVCLNEVRALAVAHWAQYGRYRVSHQVLCVREKFQGLLLSRGMLGTFKVFSRRHRSLLSVVSSEPCARLSFSRLLQLRRCVGFPFLQGVGGLAL